MGLFVARGPLGGLNGVDLPLAFALCAFKVGCKVAIPSAPFACRLAVARAVPLIFDLGYAVAAVAALHYWLQDKSVEQDSVFRDFRITE